MDKTIFFVLCILSTALCKDVCILGDDSTCPAGHCCVKETIPGHHMGPSLPPSQISCKPFRQRGEWCSPELRQSCPCVSGLTCANVWKTPWYTCQ